MWIGRRAYQQAIDDYTLAIAQQPELASAYYARGAALSELGEFEPAVRDLTRAAQIDPSDPGPVLVLSLIRSTSHDPKFRDGHRALELASRAGERSGWNSGLAWAALAAAHAELGQFRLAVQEQTKAIELSPRFEEFREQLRDYQQNKPWRHQPHAKSPSS